VGIAAYLFWRVTYAAAANQAVENSGPFNDSLDPTGPITLPEFKPPTGPLAAISRWTNLHTIIPNRPRQDPVDYTVVEGDSVFGIALDFGIDPESVLWANYDVLNDNPDQLSPGDQLIIPPTDGVLYLWQDGDTLESVAERFEAKTEDIIGWSGNRLDLTDPKIGAGNLVMLPGGHREFRQWIVPTIPRGAAGVSSSLYGAGTCEDGYEGAYGTGGFIWPAENHTLSGNDYWSGHLAIDIAAGYGAAVYAADSGVVVFSGPALGGYGNMIMIDHGNGYQTLYAHLSSIRASCGASVLQGQYIGGAGSTGRSTGPHLHFELRYLGGFVNPWFVLP
jgi:murein DD-endopeptidase MepM/ murein hydrolase activator NlpD